MVHNVKVKIRFNDGDRLIFKIRKNNFIAKFMGY